MLCHFHVLMTYYLDSRVLGFSELWIYRMVIIRYQLILPIDIKWLFYITRGSMSIQLCLSGLRMHQLIFNII